MQRQETNIQDVDHHTLRELKIVQLQLQSSNVIHYVIHYVIHKVQMSVQLSHASSTFSDVGSNKGVPTSGFFTVSFDFIQILFM